VLKLTKEEAKQLENLYYSAREYWDKEAEDEYWFAWKSNILPEDPNYCNDYADFYYDLSYFYYLKSLLGNVL